MISRDLAADQLTRLAAPTMTAFTEARQHCKRIQDASTEGRAVCSQPALGLMDGVTFWGFFASLLINEFAAVPGVEKIDGGHVFTHAWLLDETMCVQLKSDIDQLDVEQLMLPGIEDLEIAVPHLIALTWEHAGAERFGPTFVHLTPHGQDWQLPVAALLEEPVAAVPANVPKPQVTSRTQPAEDAKDAETDEK